MLLVKKEAGSAYKETEPHQSLHVVVHKKTPELMITVFWFFFFSEILAFCDGEI